MQLSLEHSQNSLQKKTEEKLLPCMRTESEQPQPPCRDVAHPIQGL
jgi:hypothetical protein